jgi:hypothetical protein
MQNFEIIESKHWKHTNGMTASIYGSCPWVSDADRHNWVLEVVGYTVRNVKTGTVGIGRKPFKTHAEALEFISQFN